MKYSTLPQALRGAVTFEGTPAEAKTYARLKLATGVAASVVLFLFLLAVTASGWSSDLERWARSAHPHPYVALAIFAGSLWAAQSLLLAPFTFFAGFVLEHRFGLSTRSFAGWVLDRAKGLALTIPIAGALGIAAYACLETFGSLWWLPVAALLTAASVGMAWLAPVVIFPLFHRFTPLTDGALRQRIMELCDRARLRFDGIFSFDMSKTTRKANAAFAGLGPSRRIILGDTLLRDFTDDEIEAVVAHELGHYARRHIRTGLLIGAVSSFAGLFAASRLYAASLPWFGLASTTQFAALPVLALWLALFGLVTTPLGNMLSRRHERQADAYAVRLTGRPDAFLSALRKLGRTNLADPSPHPVVEFLFYSHPSLSRRLRTVEAA
jgi:STE24 endopeptidase